jgi:ATP/maltotriose-dependent transcriptional regulator MalT
LDDKVGVGFALASLARVTCRLGDFEAAQRYVGEAAGIAGTPANGMKSLVALVSGVQAEIGLARGHDREAAAQARRTIELAGAQQRHTAIESRLTLAQALARSGDARSALQTAREAVRLAEEYGEPYLQLRVQAVLAEAALAAGDATAARDSATRAAEAFSRASQLDSAWRALVLQAEALLKLGDSARAADADRKANTVLDRLRSTWPSDAVAQYLARPDFAVQPYQRFTKRRTAHVPLLTPFNPVGLAAGGLSSLPSLLHSAATAQPHPGGPTEERRRRAGRG